MEELFVPYELAVKLKELGFYEYRKIAFISKDDLIYLRSSSYVPPSAIDTPLWQQAFDWFEDVHGITSCMYMCGKNVWAIEVFTPLAGNGYEWHESYKNIARLGRLEKLIELLENKENGI